jgi:cytochrome c-type biogenesis protein CcmH/NrfF
MSCLALTVLFACAGSPESGAKTGVGAEEFESIASAFTCDCEMAWCVMQTLDRCPCTYAVEARMYIRQLLASGKHSREEILKKVHKKYGGLKAGAQ